MRNVEALQSFVERSIGRAVHSGVESVAEKLWSRHPGAVALIAYGSCLRGEDPKETLIDFYLLTSDDAGVSRSGLARLGCRLLPPNVYYFEAAPYRAKYAVMTADQFARRMRSDIANPYFWARFAQPVALIRGDAGSVARALATALRTLYGHGRGLGGEGGEAFRRALAHTYRTELRSERAGRAADIVASHRDYFEDAARLMSDVAPLRANWPWRATCGKILSVLRLIKAAFTFAGGADYLVWKIARHSGETIELAPWQRRHPIVAGVLLLPRLLRSGAVR